MSTFQAPILNASPSTAATGVGPEEMERRRLALQHALAACLSAEELAHTVQLCELEFAEQATLSVSAFCQRLFETQPQIQLDKEARLRLLRAMRQPVKDLVVHDVAPISQELESFDLPEPLAIAESPPPPEPIPLASPEDSGSPELLMVTEAPPLAVSPEDSVSPDLYVLRYTNFGKEILG